MGKRSEFERIPRDYYPTPYSAVQPLLPHLPDRFEFAEPCAGDMRLIEHFADQKPTWLLFDSDWMHTKQSIPFLKMLKKVVSVGRVKWIEGSAGVGKDNCCWYLFENTFQFNPIEFCGRT